MSKVDTLGHVFARSAAAFPERPALILKSGVVTYRALDVLARSIAELVSGVAAGGRVLVACSRGPAAYASVLAVLRSGNAYVPLNPKHPPARLRLIAGLARASLLIIERKLTADLGPLLDELGEAMPVLVLEADATVHRAPERGGAPAGRGGDGRTAYLMFTSGSTGVPKGVPVCHDAVVHFLGWVNDRYRFSPADVFSQNFDLTFDLSVFDLFAAWSNGAAVAVPGDYDVVSPFRYVRDAGVTVWFSVPSVIGLVRRTAGLPPGAFPGLRWSLFCGEALSVESAAAWSRAAPGSKVENLYGPTELTVACSAHRFDPRRDADAPGGLVPIGALAPGLDHVLLDAAGEVVRGAREGELAVAGPQNFAGYWHAPDRSLAAHRLLADDDGRLRVYYRTGDLVRRSDDGSLAFAGRVDQQLKVNGYRVELAEVEAALRRCPGVEEAAAIGWPVADGLVTGLAAFVTGPAADPPAVRRALADLVPAYMVPASITALPALPLNANGKTDRRALAALLAPAPRPAAGP
jgi:amino acid adenylation domain-containing protein